MDMKIDITNPHKSQVTTNRFLAIRALGSAAEAIPQRRKGRAVSEDNGEERQGVSAADLAEQMKEEE